MLSYRRHYGAGTPPAPVVPSAPAIDTTSITLPANATRFWSFFRREGYSGSAIRVQRSSDNTERDIGFNANQMLDTSALLSFVGAGTGYVTKVYDQVGSVDMVQATQSLMPIIVSSGALVTTASGLPAMQGCISGRHLVAAGAWTSLQGLEFSMSVVAENGVAQITPTSNIYSPLIGACTSAGSGSARASLQFGVRNSVTNRNAVLEFASSSQSSNEVAGLTGHTIKQYTTCIITSTTVDANMTGGPNTGTTFYINRHTGQTTDNALHTAAAWTTATDVRLFSISATGSSWTSNNANGADAKIMSAYVGAAMTDAQRNSLEGQIYDKCSKVLFATVSASLPTLGANGEAWDFSTYASNAVSGINGKTNLQFETAANGANWTASSSGNGIAGVRSTTYTNFKNDWQADSTFGNDQLTFTMWAMFTGVDIIGASKFADIIGMCTGTLGATTSRYVSALLSKDHSPFVAYTTDVSSDLTSEYTNVMLGQNNADTGDRCWLPYSPFWGGGFLGVNVPAHDNNSDHPPFYTKKKFLGNSQTTDGAGVSAFVANNQTYLLLMKHRPHPNYIASEAYNSANNVLWRNKATVEVKLAQIGCLDGFGKLHGGRAVYSGTASTAVAKTTSRFRAYGGENLAVFDGWTHACGFFGGKYTTDAEDQALFYKLNNPNNISALV